MKKYYTGFTGNGKQRLKACVWESWMRRGAFLVEGAIALFLLVAISFVLLEASLNILKPRSYVMQQNMTDA